MKKLDAVATTAGKIGLETDSGFLPHAPGLPNVETDKVPRTLRDTIRSGLGEKWTKELEDLLFWPLANFVERVHESALKDSNSPDL